MTATRTKRPLAIAVLGCAFLATSASALAAAGEAPETHLKRQRTEQGARHLVTFAFFSDQADASFQCRLDGTPFRRCASPFRFRVRAGGHAFRVRAVSALGTADPTPAVYHWMAGD